MTTPQLRGLLKSHLKKQFAIASGCSIIAAVAWQLAVVRPRKRVYGDYFKNLDADALFLRMREAGAFQSVKPGGEINTDNW